MQIKINSDYFIAARKFINRLQDVRFAGQLVFVVIILLVSWSGIKAIQANYGLQKQVAALNQQNAVKKLQNDNLALQNQYYQSNQYLELSARENLGLGTQGEKEMIVPPSVALSYTVDLPVTTVAAPVTHKPSTIERHFTSWYNFFLHRESSTNN